MSEAMTTPTEICERLTEDVKAALEAVVHGTLDTGPLINVEETARRISEKTIAIITNQAAEIERLTEERDAALGRVEDLERDAENVSEEFEKECWKSLKSLLNLCGFDWGRDGENGVTADDAYCTIAQAINDLDDTSKSMQARALAAEAAMEKMREALETIAESHDAGRHDGLPEPCPAHDADTMWAIATQALDALTTQGGGE